MSEDENTVDTLKDVVVTEQGGGTSVSASMADAPDPMDNPTLTIPDKFKGDEQAFIKSYLELEKKMSTGGASEQEGATESTTESSEAVQTATDDEVGGKPDTDGDTSDSDTDSTTDTTDDADADSLKGKYTQLYEEQGGKLTDEQYTELSTMTGQPINSIKHYVEGLAGKTEADIAESDKQVMDAIGGVDKYTEIAKWANESLPEDQLSAVEAMLSNPELAKQGALVLKQLHMSQNTIEPKTPIEGRESGADLDIYHNNDESQEDYRNPLYKTSPKFQRMVKEKELRTMRYNRK